LEHQTRHQSPFLTSGQFQAPLTGGHAGFHNGQTQACAAGVARTGSIWPVERFTESIQFGLRHSGTGVNHTPEHFMRAQGTGLDPDRTLGGSVISGVPKEISHGSIDQFRMS
jgi:hypothetical protein